MPIYKKTDGSLVIAASNPGGGATLVTVNTSDPLSTNAPLLRGLDSSNTSIFHPANYYNGVAESSQGTSIKRADGTEVLRIDSEGMYILPTSQTTNALGGSRAMPHLFDFNICFLGCTTNNFTATSCTYVAGSTTITLSGTITGTPAIGMPVLIDYYPITPTASEEAFYNSRGQRTKIPRIIGVSGNILTLSAPLTSNTSPNYTGSVTSILMTETYCKAEGMTLKLPSGWLTTVTAGNYLFGPGIPAGTFITKSAVNTNIITVNKNCTSFNAPGADITYTPLFSAFKGTGVITKRLRLFYPDINGSWYSYIAGAGLTLNVTGYTETLDLATNSDFNRTQKELAIYSPFLTGSQVSLGSTTNAYVDDTTDATNFPTSKVAFIFDSTGTLLDINSVGLTNTLLIEMDSRNSTGTTTANTYLTYYSISIKAHFNGYNNSIMN